MLDYEYQETNSASGRVDALYEKHGTSRLQHECPKPLSHAASIRSIINRDEEQNNVHVMYSKQRVPNNILNI